MPDRPLDIGAGHPPPTPPTSSGRPDNTPFDNFDNAIVCVKTFSGYDENVVPLLNQTDGYQGRPDRRENLRFTAHFRRWDTICSIAWGSVAFGDYLVQVTSTADLSNPPAALTTHDSAGVLGGQNRFSLRAGFGTPGAAPTPAGISLFADGRLPIYVNQSRLLGHTNFYLARIVPEYAGQMLELELFDLADGAEPGPRPSCPDRHDRRPAGDLHVHPGRRAAGRRPPRRRARPTATSDSFNGRVVTVQVPLPDTYGCNAGSDLGCWFKVHLDYANSDVPTDQTTWSARVRGDPVRLVE